MTSEEGCDGPSPGTLAATTLARLEAMGEAYSPLGVLLVHLATALDAGAGLSTAAVAREFRATLKELTPRDGGDEFASFLEGLSA